MEAWFLSDIHLRTQEERNGKILLRFLHSLQTKDPAQTQLYLLGDIFDLWVGKHEHFAKKFAALMAALKALREKGMKIVYIEGNHDLHIEGYFQEKLGIEVFVEAKFFEINGVTIRLEHGDLINQDDQTYLKYRSIIRHPLVKPLGNLLPGSFWDYAGTIASKKSRSHSGNYRIQNEEKLVQMIRKHAESIYSQRPFDVIISGHMHIFDDYKFLIGRNEVRSINLGSWYEESIRVLHLEGQNLNWVKIN